MSAVMDHVRRQRAGRTETLDDASRFQVPTVAEESLELSDLARRIAIAIGELNSARRPVVRMYLAGYAQAEIQATMGWSEAKTRNLLYRGLGELRLALGRLGVGPGTA